MRFPTPRGPLSDCLFSALSGKGRHALSSEACLVGAPTADPIADEDLQLSLWACYQLHYGGFDDVDDRWEWDPAVLTFRAALEDRFERFLRHQAAQQPVLAAKDVPEALADLIATQDGASLSKFVERDATVGQFRELLMHRSLEPLHDPHTFAIPRLAGRPQAALIEIQIGELGSGHTADMRAELFRVTMSKLRLNTAPGAYLRYVPAVTLAVANVLSLFGLHRRLRGALVGQLAVYEMSAALPNRRFASGLRRLGGDAAATRLFDEHAGSDAVRAETAAHELAARFCDAEPSQAGNVLFGAAAWLYLDRRFNDHLVGSWSAGRSSLRETGSLRWPAAAPMPATTIANVPATTVTR